MRRAHKEHGPKTGHGEGLTSCRNEGHEAKGSKRAWGREPGHKELMGGEPSHSRALLIPREEAWGRKIAFFQFTETGHVARTSSGSKNRIALESKAPINNIQQDLDLHRLYQELKEEQRDHDLQGRYVGTQNLPGKGSSWRNWTSDTLCAILLFTAGKEMVYVNMKFLDVSAGN